MNQKLKVSDMSMIILLNIQRTVWLLVKKFVATSKWRPFWKCWNINHRFKLTSDMERSSQIMPEKLFFVVVTPSMTSEGGLKVVPLYSFINETRMWYMISSPAMLTVCLEQKSENVQSRNVTLSMPSSSKNTIAFDMICYVAYHYAAKFRLPI